MKILIANPALGYGGITTYFKELIKCLSLEHNLTVVLADDAVSPINEKGVTVMYHDTQELSIGNALFFINLINNELRPDLVISSQGLIIPIIVPFIDNSIKVMTVSHSGKYFSSEYSVLNHQYTDIIIAASSDYNKQYLEKKYHIKSKSKVRVMYNFISYEPRLEKIRIEKQQNDDLKIIYSGGSLPGKNPDLVLQVLCKLIKTDLNFKFYWTGGTQLPLPKKLIGHIKINDVRQFLKDDKRIVFTGRIESRNEFEEIVASSNIHLMPSRNEGCSMLLLESLRAGCICVVGDYPHSNKEIVEKGQCGFVINHNSADEFAKRLITIISNPKDYSHLYDKAYNTYIQYLSYPVWEKKLRALMAEPSNHKVRKQKINKFRLHLDILRLKYLRKTCYYREIIFDTLRSLCNYMLLYMKMMLKGDFPRKDSVNV